MDVTAETLVLSAIFLLPGYAAHRLTGYFSRRPQREPSTFDTVLTSLGVTIGILLIEAVVAAAIAAIVFFAQREWLEDLDLDVLLRSGLRNYMVEHPWEAIIALLLSAVVTASSAFIWGLHDPAGTYLERRQLDRNLSPVDMWTLALAIDRRRLGYAHANLSVKLKESGDVFQGRVTSWSLPSDRNGSRDIYLRHVTYIPGGIGQPIVYDAKRNHGSAAVISSDNIESITVLFD